MSDLDRPVSRTARRDPGARAGRGSSCIDDADVLRSGSTASVLGHRVMAPSTLGTFLRGFTFGHVRQLDQVAETLLTRAWSLGAGPGAAPMTIDLDSTICRGVTASQKQGAAYGYTKVLGYHPLLATRAETGEVLHVRFRKGSAGSGRGAERFVRELVGRIRRAGAERSPHAARRLGLLLQARREGLQGPQGAYSITVRQTPASKGRSRGSPRRVGGIDYTESGEAWVAETPYARDIASSSGAPSSTTPARALSRPSATTPSSPTGRRRGLPRRRSPSSRGRRARDPGPEGGLGTQHCPSGDFGANGAWAVLATIAHNLIRWLGSSGSRSPDRSSQRRSVAGSSRCPVGITTSADDASSTCRPLAMGQAVARVLRAARATADLTNLASRSPAEHPATSIANKSQNRRAGGSTRSLDGQPPGPREPQRA